MVRKLFAYLLIALGLGVLYISTSRERMEQISSVRNESKEWWGIHESSNELGDLVSIAYLDYVKKFHSKRDYKFKRATTHGSPRINLYIYGDSYTFKIPDSAFTGVSRYEHSRLNGDRITYSLDTTRKNILIIEHTERMVRFMYRNLYLLTYMHGYDYQPPPPEPGEGDGPFLADVNTVFDRMFRDCFNPYINQNLEYNLFNYNFIQAPRLAKAWMNYKVFGRASGDVVVSKNHSQLYLKETLHNPLMGSYAEISEEEYKTIVNNLNTVYRYYKNDGFDEVYFSAIPNPATILEPAGYNQLIPRLQADSALEMPCIDVYTKFMNEPAGIYRPGDTHWSNKGIQAWISIVNDTLAVWQNN